MFTLDNNGKLTKPKSEKLILCHFGKHFHTSDLKIVQAKEKHDPILIKP